MAEHDPGRDARSQTGEEDEGPRVTDRRRFDPETGEKREETNDTVELPGGGILHRAPGEVDVELPVGFQDLVRPFLLMGLSGLGIIPHPESGRPHVDFSLARSAIGTLELLKDKCGGNLSHDEQRLLDEALLELKMQFVEARRQAGTE